MLLMIPGIPMMNAQKTRKANSACHGRGEVKTPGEPSMSLMSVKMPMIQVSFAILYDNCYSLQQQQGDRAKTTWHLAQLLLFSV